MTSSTAEQRCRRFSLAEVRSATGDFNDAHVIGRGGFGKVYKALLDNGSLIVALKRLAPNSNQGETEFAAEMETLTKVRHRNLVSFIGYCDEEGEMILVYEYMANGTLSDHLYGLSNGVYCSSLTWSDRLRICIGAGRGLDYLHSGCSIIHRDVKSTNILLDANLTAKVSDFGLAKHLSLGNWESHVSASLKGTFGYIDPSYFATGRLTRASDTYAFGVLLLEVLTGKPALDRRMAVEGKLCMNVWAQEKIRNGKAKEIVASDLRGEISEGCLKSFVGVVKRCLYYEPKKRLTMTQAVAQLEFSLEIQEARGRRTRRLQFGPLSAFWNRVKPSGTKYDENEVGVDELPQVSPVVEEEEEEEGGGGGGGGGGIEYTQKVNELENEQNVNMLPVDDEDGIVNTETVDELENEEFVFRWGSNLIVDEIEKEQNVKLLPDEEENGIEYRRTADEIVYKWGLKLIDDEIEKKQNVEMLQVEEEGGIEYTLTVDELENEDNANVLPVEGKKDALEHKRIVDESEKEHNVNTVPVEDGIDCTRPVDELENRHNVNKQPFVEEVDGIDYIQTVDELECEHKVNMLPVEKEEGGLEYKRTLDELDNEYNASMLSFEDEEEYKEDVDELGKERRIKEGGGGGEYKAAINELEKESRIEEEEEYKDDDEFEKEHWIEEELEYKEGVDKLEKERRIEEDAFKYTQAIDTSAKLESEDNDRMMPIAVPAAEILAVTDEFSRKCWIANGSNGGSIFMGVLATGKDAAIKRLYNKLPAQEFLEQVSTIYSLKHQNVVKLHGYCADGGLQVFVYEFAPRRSLHDIIHGPQGDYGLTLEPGPGLSWPQRIEIAIGAAKGLRHVHRKGQIHRNIKSSNVLVFDNEVAKITDLHLSCGCSCRESYSDDCRHPCAFPPCFGYHPPEFFCYGHSQEGDIFSFGVVLHELLTGRKPKYSSVKEDLMKWEMRMLNENMVENIVDAELKGAYPLKAVAKVASVSGHCLAQEPHRRPSMSTVLKDLKIAFWETQKHQYRMKDQIFRSRRPSTERRSVKERAPKSGLPNANESGLSPPGSAENRAPRAGLPNTDESVLSPPDSVEKRAPNIDGSWFRPPVSVGERATGPNLPNTDEAGVCSSQLGKSICIDGRIVILFFSLFVIAFLNSFSEEFDC